MIIFWKIKYLDPNDRQCKDRHLFLDTTTLMPLERTALELALELASGRDFLRFRSLFTEDNSPDAFSQRVSDDFQFIPSLHQYFEDENGIELTSREVAQILTGSPTAAMVPAGLEQHHLDYMSSEDPTPAPVDGITLASDEVKLLGYFCRDLRELQVTAFMNNRPGTLRQKGQREWLETSATDEELRSFVTIFRRLYMTNEFACLVNAVDVFKRYVGSHPRGRWVVGEAESVARKLDAEPWFSPYKPPSGFGFNNKRLIDVFIYTQYAHQPHPNRPNWPDRQEQFEACLARVNGRRAVLTWLFLAAIYEVGGKYIAAGSQIASWFDRYCDHHQITPEVLGSLLNDHPGLGSQEKQADKEARLLGEKTEQLADVLWEKAGCPAGGSGHFLEAAKEQLQAFFRT